MKTKHTPGTWYQSHRPIPNDENGMYATQVYTEDGETIATLSWYPMPQQKEIHDGKEVLVTGTYRAANARLIAAAPELLEALQMIIETCNPTDVTSNKIAKGVNLGPYYVGSCGIPSKKAIHKAISAIKKAVGE